MKNTNTLLSLLFLIILFGNIKSQVSGDNDTTFNPGTGGDAFILTTAIQTDGKIIIGGDFTAFNGISANHLARLNSDGTLDATFVTGSGLNGTVHSIAVQPDGKIIIGGGFNIYDGISRNGIARLNSDGTIDPTFNPSLGISGGTGDVYSISIQTDGLILIGGNFTSYYGIARNNLARLNTNGTLDLTFDPGTGTNETVRKTIIQPDGNIIIAGDFTSYNGTVKNKIARVNSTGILDGIFNSGSGANDYIFSADIQSDGKILIGGNFTSYNGVPVNRISRLNIDGTFDGTFNPGTGLNDWVRTIKIQPDGKIIIGGVFTLYNGISMNHIARLNSNASIDTSFHIGTAANNEVYTCSLQSDGKIIIGGQFTSYKGYSRKYIARIGIGSTNTSAQLINKHDIKIFPNPANTYINIDKSNLDIEQIVLVNLSGEIIMKIKAVSKITTINIDQLPSGTYFIRLENSKLELVYVQKIMK